MTGKTKKILKIILPLALLGLILASLLYFTPLVPASDQDSASLSVAAQIRKLQIQIKKLQAIVAELTKLQEQKKPVVKTVTKSTNEPASPKVDTPQPGFTPFGGKIVFKQTCDCSGNELIKYIPVKPDSMPKNLSYRKGPSTLYEYKNLDIGMQILGLASTPDPCIITAPVVGCIPSPMQEDGIPLLIAIVGTSDPSHQAGQGENAPAR